MRVVGALAAAVLLLGALNAEAGAAAGGTRGESAAGAGCERRPGHGGADYNGDGYPDLAVADPNALLRRAGDGSVHLLLGTAEGPPRLDAADSLLTAARSPWSMRLADVDADGCADLVVGGPHGPDVRDRAVIFWGGRRARPAFAQVDAVSLTGDIDGSVELLGWSVAAAEGVVAVGAPGAEVDGVPRAGAVYVFPVGPGREVGAPIRITQETAGVPGGSERGDLFGWSVALGRLGGDPDVLDLAIGTPYEDIGGRVDGGTVTVVYDVTRLRAGDGASRATRWSLADLAIDPASGPAPTPASGAGSGTASDTAPGTGSGTASDTAPGAGSGTASGDAADAESVAPSGGAVTPGPRPGSITASGTASSAPPGAGPGTASAADAGSGRVSGDRFGHALAYGEWRGTGYLAAGAPGAAAGGAAGAGLVQVFAEGRATGAADAGGEARPVRTLRQGADGVPDVPEPGDGFGFALGFAGGDLLVGSPFESVGDVAEAGAVVVVPLDGSPGVLVTEGRARVQAHDHFGWSVTGVGAEWMAVGVPDERAARGGAIALVPVRGGDVHLLAPGYPGIPRLPQAGARARESGESVDFGAVVAG